MQSNFGFEKKKNPQRNLTETMEGRRQVLLRAIRKILCSGTPFNELGSAIKSALQSNGAIVAGSVVIKNHHGTWTVKAHVTVQARGQCRTLVLSA